VIKISQAFCTSRIHQPWGYSAGAGSMFPRSGKLGQSDAVEAYRDNLTVILAVVKL